MSNNIWTVRISVRCKITSVFLLIRDDNSWVRPLEGSIKQRWRHRSILRLEFVPAIIWALCLSPCHSIGFDLDWPGWVFDFTFDLRSIFVLLWPWMTFMSWTFWFLYFAQSKLLIRCRDKLHKKFTLETVNAAQNLILEISQPWGEECMTKLPLKCTSVIQTTSIGVQHVYDKRATWSVC